MKAYVSNRKVLFLDDETNLLKSLGRLVSRLGFEPTITSDPDAALSLLDQQTFAIIVSDYRMPKMVGTEFLTKAKAKCPRSIRILLTGYADIGAAIQAVNNASVYKYLTKPWEETLIKQTLDEACQQYNLGEENILLQKQVKVAAIQLKEINKNLEQLVEKRTQEIRLLNRQLESGFLASIKLMGTVAHRGDTKGAEHARRVATLSVEIGKEFALPERELLELQIAGFLHDITESFEAPSRTHTTEAYELMKMIPNLGRSYDYVRLHHERMNGTGFPGGLKGEQIPLGARILALADAFDEALFLAKNAAAATPNKVLYELKQKCPQEYDESVFSALYELLKRKGKLNDLVYETTVSLINLVPGMILSRDLATRSGKVLLPKDCKITSEYLNRLFKRNAEDPVDREIHVYRNSVSEIQKRRSA